jgi:uncharacterized protein (TIGR03435 family)
MPERSQLFVISASGFVQNRFVRRRLLRALAVAVFVAIPVFAAQDQSFEVASIKRNTSGDRNSLLRVLPGGRMSATNFAVRQLIVFAWQLAGQQVVGGPAWIDSDGYDIIAKMDGNPDAVEPGKGLPDPRQTAVQRLLADRFKLKTHREVREMDIYALVLARPGGHGPKLIPSPQDCAAQAAAARGNRTPFPAPGPAPELGKPYCGIAGSNGRIRFGGLNATMMAQAFNGYSGRIVVDRTGLDGSWDFELRFAPRRGVDAPAGDPDLPDFFTAVQEQLGLKLESTKGPVEVFAIDSVERPTED